MDFIIWLPYVIVFLGFVCFFHSVGNAHRVTDSLDLYFSTTDNPDANAVSWVDIQVLASSHDVVSYTSIGFAVPCSLMLLILLVQTEPDLWHYIDNVLVEELLFGEEYELSDHGAKAAASRRRLKSTGKKPVIKTKSSKSHSNTDDDHNQTEYKHTPGNYSGCDPNHLDKAVTLHYVSRHCFCNFLMQISELNIGVAMTKVVCSDDIHFVVLYMFEPAACSVEK